MKYLTLRATPDPAVRPGLFELLSDVPFVTETRLVDWNVGDVADPTLLFSITGEIETFRDAITEGELAVEWEVTPIDDERFYWYLRPSMVPLLASILEAVTTEGLLVVTPVVYRDGSAHARFVGDPDVLQQALTAVPERVDVDVRAVGEYDGGSDEPLAALSQRQREAIDVAMELGYFEQPRQATHADVAERMDCAASTASEHLQKAQARLVEQVLADRASSGRA